MIEFTRLPTGEPPTSKKVAINPDKVTMISPSCGGTYIAFDQDSGIAVTEHYEIALSKFSIAERDGAR